MNWESSDVVRFDLGPHLQGQSVHNLLIICPRGLQCQTYLYEIMGWVSSVFRFGLGPLRQGQMRIAKFKMFITRFSLVLEVYYVKQIYRKSWARNILMSDLTLPPPPFKVK